MISNFMNFLFIGITLEQQEKLINQQKQYIEAKLKLEDQLLKLKACPPYESAFIVAQ